MSENLKFSGAEVSLVLHATEDERKVLTSVRDTVLIQPERFSCSTVDGHFKNKISRFKATLSSSEASQLILHIASRLNNMDRNELLRNIEQYSDEKGNFYLRLDKQRLCQGKISISSTDSIRIKFRSVKRYKPAGNVESYRGILSSNG